MEKCNEIPPLVELNDYSGDYNKYEEKIYEIYEDTFGRHQYFFQGKRVAHKKHPEFQGKPCTFWHIISDGEQEESRIPNMNRYARIAWPAFILSHCVEHCGKVLIWENKRKSKRRAIIWCKEIEYVIVLDKRKDYYIFWTAYPVTRKHTKEKMQKEYEEYIKQKTLV